MPVTFVRIASHSALFLVDQSQALLEGKEILGGMDAQSKWTLMLLHALNAALSAKPIMLHWSADLVSKFESLPGQFLDKGLSWQPFSKARLNAVKRNRADCEGRRDGDHTDATAHLLTLKAPS